MESQKCELKLRRDRDGEIINELPILLPEPGEKFIWQMTEYFTLIIDRPKSERLENVRD